VSLAEDLVASIRAGDPARVNALVVAANEKERRAAAGAVEKEFHEVMWKDGARNEAAALARAGTATARQVGSEWYALQRQHHARSDPAIATVVLSRGRAFVETIARRLLQDEFFVTWDFVRRAVREGVIARPDDERYTLAMVRGLGGAEAYREEGSVFRGLLEDEELLDRELWTIFEVDAASELGSATVWEPGPGVTATQTTRNRWQYALLRLAEEGRIDRVRLLDASLDALTRDFRASTVGWYASFHESLEPSREERVARLDRYLALLGSPAPAVVKEGLAALRSIESEIPLDVLARVAVAPLTGRQKNLATETLALLDRCAKRQPDAAATLLAAAAHALGHERQDVQERALALIERRAYDAEDGADVRGAALGYVEVVSPTLRARVEALAGVSLPAEPVETVAAEGLESRLAGLGPAASREAARAVEAARSGRWPDPVRPEPTPELLRRVGTPLVPVETANELIELGAALLEGAAGGDDAERFLDGVSRLSAERPGGFEQRTAGLAKRAEAIQRETYAASGTALVANLVLSWTRRRRPGSRSGARGVFAVLEARVHEAATRARRGVTRPLLAMPTHAGGWIDPAVLDERVSGVGRLRNRPDLADREQAAARAFPAVEPPAFRPEPRLHRQPWAETRWIGLRLEGRFTGLDGLDRVVEAVASRGEPSEWWRGESTWAGWDALSADWCLTVLPTLPEVGFAGAFAATVHRIDDSMYFHPDVVLRHALAEDVRIGGIGWLATAAGLLAKSPDVHRPAVDLLVQTVTDGRFDPIALGEALAWLLDHDTGTIGRLDAPLRDAGRVSALHGAQVVRFVEALVASLTTAPRNLHVPLEIALELATALRMAVEGPQARAALERIAGDSSRTSKLGRASRALLSLEADHAAVAALRLAAAEPAVARAERTH
jgi:Family of unknown function (DUF6493)